MFCSLSGLTVPTASRLLNRIPRFRTVRDGCSDDKRDGLITDSGWFGCSSNLLLTHHLGKLEEKGIVENTLFNETRVCVLIVRREWECSVSHADEIGRRFKINAILLCSLSMTSKPQPVAVETPTQGEASYEETHVHKVYEEIASHFSETRYKVCYFSLWFFIRQKDSYIAIELAMAGGRDIPP